MLLAHVPLREHKRVVIRIIFKDDLFFISMSNRTKESEGKYVIDLEGL